MHCRLIAVVAAVLVTVLAQPMAGQAQPPDAVFRPGELTTVELVDEAERLAEEGDHAGVLELVPEVLQRKDLNNADAFRFIAVGLTAARAENDSVGDERLLTAARQVIATLVDPGEIWRLNARLTSHLILQGQFAEAEQAALAALPYKDQQPPEAQAELINYLGVARTQQGRLDQALADMHQSLDILDRAGLDAQPALLMNMAALSLHLKDYESSVELGQRVLEMVDDDVPFVPGLYSNLGAGFIELGRVEEAEAAFLEAIRIGESRGAPSTTAIGNLAYLHREHGDHEQALDGFRRQLALDQASGRTDSPPVALKNIGQTLMLMGEHDQARLVFEESLAGYRQVDVRMRRLELYPVMIENLEILGDDERALTLMKEFKELNDEQINVESQERIAELQSRIELERRERELVELEQRRVQGEQELATLRATQAGDRILLTALILGVTALIVIALLLVRTVTIRGRANRLLSANNLRIEHQQRELEVLNRQLELKSQHDELTGLGNRRALRDFVDKVEASGCRPGSYLLLLFDLDHFKAINDRHGHDGGDQVLVAVARSLERCAGERDLLVRWGGEEFLWLLADRGLDDAAAECERLRATLAAVPVQINDVVVEVGFSAGCVALPFGEEAPGQQFRDAIRLADSALYQAKSRGRGSLVMIRANDPWQPLPAGSLDLDQLVEEQRIRTERRVFEANAAVVD